MTAVVFVVLAAVGTLARALITTLDGDFPRRMYGTAVVNIAGSFLLGLLDGSTDTTLTALGIGGLGAFTTFSTYVSQIECIDREGSRAGALLYAFGSLIAGIAAALAGMAITS